MGWKRFCGARGIAAIDEGCSGLGSLQLAATLLTSQFWALQSAERLKYQLEDAWSCKSLEWFILFEHTRKQTSSDKDKMHLVETAHHLSSLFELLTEMILLPITSLSVNSHQTRTAFLDATLRTQGFATFFGFLLLWVTLPKTSFGCQW